MKDSGIIKRFLWSLTRDPLSRLSRTWRLQKPFAAILLAGFGLISALAIPALSQSEVPRQPQELAQQGREFYERGNLEQAIQKWEQAANYYELENEQRTANLINAATAQQALGLYGESCTTVLSAFAIQGTDCIKLLANAQPLEQKFAQKLLKEPLEPLATKLQNMAQLNNVPDLEAIIIEQSPGEPQQAEPSFALLQPLVQEPYNLSQATGLLRLGDYFTQSNYPQLGAQTLDLSLHIAVKLNDPRQETAALLSLGNSIRAITDKKQNQFSPKTVILDNILNNRDPVNAALKTYQAASAHYHKAAELAQSPINRLKAQMNNLSMSLDTQEFWQKAIADLKDNLSLLDIPDSDFRNRIVNGANQFESYLAGELTTQIDELTTVIRPQLDNLNNLQPTRAGVFARINFAQSLIRQKILNDDTAEILIDAIASARELKNPSAEAEARGYLGYFYQQKEQYAKARQLTTEALALAPAINYPGIAYRWHAQLGNILAQQEDREAALAAYKASFRTISALRSDLATTPVENIFREYIALLLADDQSNPEELEEAREVLESLQITELDNFFRDPCSPVAEDPVLIDGVDKQAAVIYPIILKNSLKVIVTLPEQPLQLYTTNIPRQEVNKKIDKLLSKTFRNPRFAEDFRGARGNPEQQARVQESLDQSLAQDIRPLAKEIYDWLLAEAEPLFQKNEIKTLVFVLDGPLRSIPMSLLYDGEQYLIEKDYNIVLTSGLQITDPQPLKPQPIKVLAAGTTEGDKDFGFSRIPEVETELNLISSLFPDSKVLLNQDFTPTSLSEQLEAADYPIVHLATHGQFSSTSDQTFILSGSKSDSELDKEDRFINVKEFDTLLRVGKRRGSQSIELLVLSACETAQGDNRAILGLAGVAVRAGARSTIATLWGADDKATAELMGYFYQNLNDNPEISKAAALQDAQLKLLQNTDSQYSHPYYWAPFVFIGNWL